MSSLDTRVDGNPGAVHAAADGLGTIAAGLSDTGSTIARASTMSEGLWSGAAADAFRSGMLPVRRATDEVADAARRASRAMHEFADELSAVRDMVERAKTIASSAGLEVAGDSIQRPKPPPAPPAMALSPAAAAAAAEQLAAEAAEYRRKLRAYREAREILTEARAKEQTAHEQLDRRLTSAQSTVDNINGQGVWLAGGTWASTVSNSIKNADKWINEAHRLTEQRDAWWKVANDPTATPAERATARQRLAETSKARTQALTNSASDTRVARANTLGYSDSAGRSALSKAGPAAALAQGAYDVATADGLGKKAHAAASAVGGYAAGEVAGAGAAAAFATIGIAGAPSTLGASLIAAGVGYGVSELIKHPGAVVDAGEAVVDTAKDAANTIADGVKSVTKINLPGPF